MVAPKSLPDLNLSPKRFLTTIRPQDVRPQHLKSRPPERAACAASTLQRFNGFTLLELLIVVGIVGLLMVLMAPAFTYIKGGTDVTSAAYTIKGVLDTARTYAKANNTYTWVGFYEEDVSAPSRVQAQDPRCTGCVGRLVMSIVASKDGTYIYDPNAAGTENFMIRRVSPKWANR